jgi:hypothetical protein
MRAEQFSANLKAVSQSIASQDGVDSVSIRHVNEGHAALARVGLTPRNWYLRTEFEVGAGTILIGIGCASPTLTGFFFDPTSRYLIGTTIALLCICFVAGLIFSIHGWMRGSMPQPPRHHRKWRWLACWPWTQCEHADQVAIDGGAKPCARRASL